MLRSQSIRVNEAQAKFQNFKDSIKERVAGSWKWTVGSLQNIKKQPKVLLEDEKEVFLQVGRTVWHVPRELRVELWLSSLQRKNFGSALVDKYQDYLLQEITQEAQVDIDKDIQRTFPNTRRFHSEEGQLAMRNVLYAYAAYDSEVGYCQGMNFVTGLLLMYMPTEAQAFAALVVLMDDQGLRKYYSRSMSLLQVQLWQLGKLISPKLNQHLENCGVVPMLYGASWLMTCFSADFPPEFSARILDVLLADQCECALLKVAVAILKKCERKLRNMADLEDILSYLKVEVPAWDVHDLNDLLSDAFNRPWTQRQLSVINCTEGAETVAQAMDRVLTFNQESKDDEDAVDGREEGEAMEAGVRACSEDGMPVIPLIKPPPSYLASPGYATPTALGSALSTPLPLDLTQLSTSEQSVDGVWQPPWLETHSAGRSPQFSFSGASQAQATSSAWAIPSHTPSAAVQEFQRKHASHAAASKLHKRNSCGSVTMPRASCEGIAEDEWGEFAQAASNMRGFSRSMPSSSYSPSTSEGHAGLWWKQAAGQGPLQGVPEHSKLEEAGVQPTMVCTVSVSDLAAVVEQARSVEAAAVVDSSPATADSGPVPATDSVGTSRTPMLLIPPPPPSPLNSSIPCSPSAASALQQRALPALPADTVEDIAGDILRTLTAVDTSNAMSAYNPRHNLGEGMFADSPSKELGQLCPDESTLANLELDFPHLSASNPVFDTAAIAAELVEPVFDPFCLAATTSDAAVASEAQGLSGSTSSTAVADDMASEVSAPSAPDEWVLKKPVLYVDGIAMFDPKTLMSDDTEPQTMFSPELMSPVSHGHGISVFHRQSDMLDSVDVSSSAHTLYAAVGASEAPGGILAGDSSAGDVDFGELLRSSAASLEQQSSGGRTVQQSMSLPGAPAVHSSLHPSRLSQQDRSHTHTASLSSPGNMIVLASPQRPESADSASTNGVPQAGALTIPKVSLSPAELDSYSLVPLNSVIASEHSVMPAPASARVSAAGAGDAHPFKTAQSIINAYLHEKPPPQDNLERAFTEPTNQEDAMAPVGAHTTSLSADQMQKYASSPAAVSPASAPSYHTLGTHRLAVSSPFALTLSEVNADVMQCLPPLHPGSPCEHRALSAARGSAFARSSSTNSGLGLEPSTQLDAAIMQQLDSFDLLASGTLGAAGDSADLSTCNSRSGTLPLSFSSASAPAQLTAAYGTISPPPGQASADGAGSAAHSGGGWGEGSIGGNSDVISADGGAYVAARAMSLQLEDLDDLVKAQLAPEA